MKRKLKYILRDLICEIFGHRWEQFNSNLITYREYSSIGFKNGTVICERCKKHLCNYIWDIVERKENER